MYTLQYELTDEDYLKFNITHRFSTPALRQRTQIYRFGFAAMYAALAVIWLFFFPSRTLNVIFGIAFAGIACFYLFGMTWRIKRSMRRSMDRLKSMGKLPYDTTITITFDEDGIHSVSENKEETTKYSAIERILLGEDAMYIYDSAATANLVPYRAFQTEQERQEFLDFLEAKTNVKAVPGQTK